jgi:hypothetical protein
VFDIVHCLTVFGITLRFGSWVFFDLQVNDRYYTDTFFLLCLLLVTAVEMEPRTNRKLLQLIVVASSTGGNSISIITTSCLRTGIKLTSKTSKSNTPQTTDSARKSIFVTSLSWFET